MYAQQGHIEDQGDSCQKRDTCITDCYAAQLQNPSYSVWQSHYKAGFPNTSPIPGVEAHHDAGTPQVFGKYPRFNALELQVVLSKYMKTAWPDFAQDPSGGPALDWPEFGSRGLIQALGANGSHSSSAINAALLEGICNMYERLITTQGYTRSVALGRLEGRSNDTTT